MNVTLDDRNKKILYAIVQIYIKTAEPVGSRTIARHSNLGISPATIRNAMNDLEELGLIAQPHTSAGRIPTHKGYRFFVDALMDKKKLTKQEEENIQTEYNIKINNFGNEIFRLTSRLLSMASDCTGVAIAPNISKSSIKKVEFIPISDKKILMVLITNSNLVRNKIIDLSEDVSSDELHSISKMFTDKVEGLTLSEIRDIVMNRLEIKKPNYDELLKNAIIFAKSTLIEEHDDDVYLEGTSNILKHPEFSKIAKTKEIFKILEEKKNLVKLFEEVISNNGVNAFIGEENHISEMQDCSLVLCPYKIKGHPSGIIGIIGPTRMKYGKIFSIVEFTSNQLEKTITNLIE
ncbi:heat-inducible transcription repressor HrcA [Candidatus Poribacteria bacterium]|nr:heat-inducible transcription repressor HrcA [Candidatus Poribacteria bacterium]